VFTIANHLTFLPQRSSEGVFVFGSEKTTNTLTIKKTEFIQRLQIDIFADKEKIADVIIQPAGEMQLPEVTAFIEKYL
jgi:hypothetical protein